MHSSRASAKTNQSTVLQPAIVVQLKFSALLKVFYAVGGIEMLSPHEMCLASINDSYFQVD